MSDADARRYLSEKEAAASVAMERIAQALQKGGRQVETQVATGDDRTQILETLLVLHGGLTQAIALIHMLQGAHDVMDKLNGEL